MQEASSKRQGAPLSKLELAHKLAQAARLLSNAKVEQSRLVQDNQIEAAQEILCELRSVLLEEAEDE